MTSHPYAPWRRGPLSRGWLAAVLVCGLLGACTSPSEPSGVERRSPAVDGEQAAAEGDASPSPSPSPPVEFTIAATGDTLVHGPVADAAAVHGQASGRRFDFRPMFAAVRPLIAGADLAICHLETPLSADDANLSYYPVFTVPREVAGALAHAGYDLCSTASNHAFDGGASGVEETLDVLDDNGIGHAGMARRPAEARRAATFEVGGAKVALLSYTYGLNGFSLPAGQPYLVRSIDPPQILADARRARRQGADFVAVSLHWGLEYQSAPTSEQKTIARTLLKADSVDVILGHHAHVVQPIARVGRKYVVFGMGNFLSNQSWECCPEQTQDGVIVRLSVRENAAGKLRVAGVRYTPTWVNRGPFEILPVAGALRSPDTPPELGAELQESWTRTVAAFEPGDGVPGVKPGPPTP